MSDELPANKFIEIEFFNRTGRAVSIWVKLACILIELDNATEYRIVTHERYYRFEFDHNEIILYLQTTFGFKLFKRPASAEYRNPNEWILEMDWSDIN